MNCLDLIVSGAVPADNQVLFVLTESDWLLSKYPELQSVVKEILRQGRHAKTPLWLSTQSPLASSFGLRTFETLNGFSVYLGAAIVEGAEKHGCDAARAKNLARTEYSALVCPLQGAPFGGKLPVPGFYSLVS